MSIKKPYLLFIGNSKAQHCISVAQHVVDLQPEYCIGEYTLPDCLVTAQLPQTDIWQAAERGVKSFIIGFSSFEQQNESEVIATIIEALEAGLDIVSDYQLQLNTIDLVRHKAQVLNRQLIDAAELLSIPRLPNTYQEIT